MVRVRRLHKAMKLIVGKRDKLYGKKYNELWKSTDPKSADDIDSTLLRTADYCLSLPCWFSGQSNAKNHESHNSYKELCRNGLSGCFHHGNDHH